MKALEDMTPRQKTWALKKQGIRIDCIYPFNPACDYWFVEFSNGSTMHIRNTHAYKPYDGRAYCEQEARQIATDHMLSGKNGNCG